MIFHLPYSWLKEYVWVPKNPHDLARELSLYGPSIERVEALRHEFTKVIVGEIVSIERHPHADKLQVALVQTGRGAPLRIVCGAPNIRVGQKVPLALLGATLPGDIKVGRREVRGVVSEGMLCSARELGIHDDHLGILILHPESKIGASLAGLGNAEDHILEVEPTTNRPDLSSVIGVAREVSAITGKPLNHTTTRATNRQTYPCPLTVKVMNRKLCPRFMAVLIKNIAVGASPWRMQERLARAGIRPINAVVDITNYVLLEYGQPLHAFDADKLGQTIIVRPAKKGDKILALDGRTYNLKPSHLVVADQKNPVSIAGVMGGEATAVTDKTVAIVLECANFDPLSIRKTSRDLQLFSESSRLFEKGLSEEAPAAALARAIELVQKICGGATSEINDNRVKPYHPVTVSFALSNLPRILGISVPAPAAKRLLGRLGFAVKESRQKFTVTVPYWRDHDVCQPEDLVEEVARLYGYHRFASLLLPAAPATRERKNDFAAEDNIRRHLSAMGFTEVMSYSLIRESWLRAMQYPADRALRVANPLNNDLVFMRPSLLPSLAAIIEQNLSIAEEIRIFEIAKVYVPGDSKINTVDGYRQESVLVSAVVTGGAGDTAEGMYRAIRGYGEDLLNSLGRSLKTIKMSSAKSRLPFAAGSSVALEDKRAQYCGAFGLLDPVFLKAFGVNQLVAAFNFPLSIFAATALAAYKPIPKFPAVKRDLALAVGPSVRYNDLEQTMRAATPLLESVELFDVYGDERLGKDRQSYAMHLIYRAPDRTLSSAEVEAAEAKMLEMLKQKFNVKPR